MSDLLVSVRNLLEKVQEFDKLEPGQQGATRAHLSRLLNQVEDEEIKGVLLKVRGIIGASTSRSYDKVTVEDVEKEFAESFPGYSSKQRAPFKAKVTRMMNEATEAGETEDRQRLATIQLKIADLERRETKSEIFNLLGGLIATENEDEDEPDKE